MATIYTLALHEELELDRYNVVNRFLGGWLYKPFTGTQVDNFNQIGVEFVPYNTQFLPVAGLCPSPLDFEGRRLISNHGSNTEVGYGSVFRLTGDDGISEDVDVTCSVIGTAVKKSQNKNEK